jgi:hypothetical protein
MKIIRIKSRSIWNETTGVYKRQAYHQSFSREPYQTSIHLKGFPSLEDAPSFLFGTCQNTSQGKLADQWTTGEAERFILYFLLSPW